MVSAPNINIMPEGRFLVQHVGDLGEGGLGHVDRIVVTASNCAGKQVSSQWARKRLNSRWNSQPTAVERFEREITVLRRMNHPNIVTLEGENVSGERFYLMPLYTSSLRRHIASGGWTGKWVSIAKSGIVLAEALQYAHNMGFIHRDLKPDNILFNDGGPLVLADWGLGYFIHKESKVLQQLTRGGMGTEYYCSVEQWATGKCDARGDIYSLGMTLDEWARGEQRSIRVGMGIDGPSVRSDTRGAAAFNRAIDRMTQVLAGTRPTSMSVVVGELKSALQLDGML